LEKGLLETVTKDGAAAGGGTLGGACMFATWGTTQRSPSWYAKRWLRPARCGKQIVGNVQRSGEKECGDQVELHQDESPNSSQTQKAKDLKTKLALGKLEPERNGKVFVVERSKNRKSQEQHIIPL